jgi:translocation and assembly module TamB
VSRPWRIGIMSFAGLLLLGLLVVIAGISILRSDWFFQRIRQATVTGIEKSTGGKVELNEFHFNWSTLTAEADGLVIHGTELPPEAPLFRAAKIVIGLRLISLAKRQVDVAAMDIVEPQVNLILSSDGRTNIPEPKTRRSDRRIDETILDMAIGRFGIQKGTVQVKAAGQSLTTLPWTAAGENLKAKLNYTAHTYRGNISIEPLRASYGDSGPIAAAIDLAITFERDHLQVSDGKLRTATSHVEFAGDLRNLTAPEISGRYTAHIAADEAGRLLAWRTHQNGIIDASGDFRINNGEGYRITGKLQAADLTYRDPDLHFERVRLSSGFSASPRKIQLTNLHAAVLGGQVDALATLTDFDHFEIKGSLSGLVATSIAELLKTAPPPMDARVAGPFEARGSLSALKYRRIDASAQITLSPVDSKAVSGFLDAHYDGQRQYVDLAKSFIALPSSRIEFSGGLGVKTGGYTGQLQVHLTTRNPADLLVVAPAFKTLPLVLQKGYAEFNGTLAGALDSPTIAGHVNATNVLIEKQSIEAFSADVNASSTQVQIRNGALAYQNMRARVSGTLALHQWRPDNQSAITGTASMQNADIANLLALLGKTQIPIKGSLTAETQVNGTLADPRATATLHGGKGSAYGEPFDRATANVTYVSGGRQDFTVELDAGVKKVNLSGTFQHAATDFFSGTIHATVKSSDLALNQIQAIRQYQPTVGGSARGSGDFEVRLLDTQEGEQWEVASLNADVFTRNLAVDNKQLGDVHLTAHTVAGQQPPLITAQLDANVAHSAIRGTGNWRLVGDYPGAGEVTFSKVNLAEIRKLFAPHATSLTSVGGSVEGKITFSGAAEKPRAMTGTLEIPSLVIKPEPGGEIPIPESLRDLVIQNQGPIRATMTNGNIRVESARVTARSTDLSLAGTVNLNAQSPLDMRASGSLDLSILPMFARDLVSSGTVAATATIRGAFAQPEILGRLDVKNANLSFEGLPNGLSNANGTVTFDPSRATIQSLSAETGGGKVNLTGFLAFSNGPMALRLEADAKEVRVRYPEGVSTVANANLRLVGTSERSTLSGTITVIRSAFTPHTDLGQMLANAAAPVQTPAVQTGLIGNMQFDVDILTSPDVSFQTKLAQSLQADATLRLRGTLSSPVLLGRVNINQGELTFFGNKYNINDGTISFFNPVKLEPVLDVSLETRARGVDVTINVTGPLNKLNVNYRSDPPLQFADLVALLATGRTPENPTLAARDPGTTQTWQEMGASALLGQAIANPLTGRLQRFFGVSKIKIDPLLTGVAGNAQARLTIEQNVTPDLTFTYITNVASSTGSAQVIRVEWDFAHHWSVVATRDEYGYFGMDFQYRKRLK